MAGRACGVAALLVPFLGTLLWGSGPATTRKPDGLRSTAPIASGLAGDDRVAAVLAPRRRAVLSAEVSGRVTAISKELGEPFAPDELLMQLDDLPYRVGTRIAQAALESARSDLDRIQKLATRKTRERRAEAVLAAAQANLVATQRLFENNRASKVDLENARRDATVAQSQRELVDSTATKELTDAKRELVAATGESELAADQLEACRITGPWAGRVIRVLVNEHELVERGTPVVEVIDDRLLLAKFLLPSSVFRSVRVGQELRLAVNETSSMVRMKVSHIAAALDPASVTFEVHAEISNADGTLRAGMNGTVSLSEIAGR